MKDFVYEYGRDILTSDKFLRETAFRHHGAKSCFCHSVSVAYESVKMAARYKNVDYRSLVRGALLHDYYLYDWHKKDASHRLHGFYHAKKAMDNAETDFGLNDVERDIIFKHMFPLNLRFPRYKETFIVSMADKKCSVGDFTGRGACRNTLVNGKSLGSGITDIVFDLDGTLVDTSDAIIKTWRQTLADYGYDFSYEYLSGIVNGISIGRSLSILGVEDDGRFADRWLENHGRFIGKVGYFKDALKALAYLRKKGLRLGIVTSRPRTEYERYLAGLHVEKYVDVIVLADETEKHKPVPEPLLKYTELAGAKIERCMYVGDMSTDVACANAAGARSCFIRRGKVRPLPEADYNVRKLTEIKNLIK